MADEWWVCAYCFRSNHPFWSHCQTCRAPRPEADATYETAPREETEAEQGGSRRSRAITKARSARPRREAADKEDQADDACPQCARPLEEEWNLCPHCGWARPRPQAEPEPEKEHKPEPKLLPLPAPSSRPLRRLGLVPGSDEQTARNGRFGKD